MNKIKVYIAGKIEGDIDYSDKFYLNASVLEDAGLAVLNPASLPLGMTKADYMRINFAQIDVADIVLFFADWKDSEGARLEHSYCVYTGKKHVYLDDRYEALIYTNRVVKRIKGEYYGN